MKKRPIVKWPRQQPWLLALVLGLLCVAGILVGVALGRLHQSPQAETAVFRPSAAHAPSPTPTPTNTPVATKEYRPKQSKPDSSPQPSNSPQQMPVLTPEQQAINEKFKASFGSYLASFDAQIKMQVAIAQGVPALTLATSTGATLLDQDGQSLQTLSPGTSYTVQAEGDAIALDSSPLPHVVWIQPAPEGLFYLGDRAYRGDLLLVSEAGRLWAVNSVSLRSYLYSVVASEVSPSWNMEALKAQAVAARSYALTYHIKPVNGLFDLGNDEYYQVYSGIEREHERTNAAVDATAGEYVSYKGGIVESLYAASDDIVAEAFQGKGMSQLGALNLAEQGYAYQQILANYYPGTKVGRIEITIE